MSKNTEPKERERFYLLPGMGGRALRRKRLQMIVWGVVVGLAISATLAAILYFLNGSSPGPR